MSVTLRCLQCISCLSVCLSGVQSCCWEYKQYLRSTMTPNPTKNWRHHCVVNEPVVVDGSNKSQQTQQQIRHIALKKARKNNGTPEKNLEIWSWCISRRYSIGWGRWWAQKRSKQQRLLTWRKLALKSVLLILTDPRGENFDISRLSYSSCSYYEWFHTV